VAGAYNRNFGFSFLINSERPDKNYGWSYFSLILYLGCSRFSNGKEVINWEKKINANPAL
jgi:hypothetical protein